MSLRVAVVGAGISGLTCAGSLVDQDLDVTVFDKGRRPGGRTSTRRAVIDGTEHRFDHGAQYFTVRSSELAERVEDWERLGVVSRWHGRIVALDRDGRVEPSESRARFVGTPSMSSLGEHLAEGLDVRCGVRVASIRPEGRNLVLADEEDGSLGAFDVVVCTAPPAQTAALLHEVAPAIATRASAVEMAPCWAVMAKFDPALDVDLDGAFVNHGPLSWVARTSSKPGRIAAADCWVLHAGPAWSEAHLEDDPEVVADTLLTAWFEALKSSPITTRWRLAHRWRYALARTALTDGCLWDASLRIGACGDWVHGNRVEGAWLSGRDLAARIGRDLGR